LTRADYSCQLRVDSGGGGYQVRDLYDINPSKFGQVDNQVTQASRFGDQQQVYTGIDTSPRALAAAAVCPAA